MSAVSNHILSIALNSMKSSSSHKTDEHWPTFEEILQRLHAQGIYIHNEQLAEFLLAHGLPVHLRYVPRHLFAKAIEVNRHYNGDMVRVVEEPEPPSWDFSWMENIQEPLTHNSLSERVEWWETTEQPTWDYSWMK